jgi:hypothetical protein
MKIKTLLLGSAGVLAVAGGAQAADLSVAEPVEYVKVCDAFGVNYWYIPGSDTCLKIGGFVRFDVLFHTAADTMYGTTDNHSATWEFQTIGSITATAKSMTEYGALTGFVDLRAASNNNVFWGTDGGNAARDGTRGGYFDTAWLEFGPLLAGRLASAYDYSGGLTIDGSDFDADQGTDQVRLTWAMSGFGVMLGIEDPRDRWGSGLSASYSMPNIVAAITASQAHWDGKLSFGWAETTSGSGFGVQAAATIKLNEIAKGDALVLKAAWAQGQVASWADGSGNVYGNGTSVWMVLGSFKHFWTPQLSSAITASWTDRPSNAVGGGTTTGDVFQTKFNLVWAPVTNFFAGIEGAYVKSQAGLAANGIWSAKIRLQRSW